MPLFIKTTSVLRNKINVSCISQCVVTELNLFLPRPDPVFVCLLSFFSRHTSLTSFAYGFCAKVKKLI